MLQAELRDSAGNALAKYDGELDGWMSDAWDATKDFAQTAYEKSGDAISKAANYAWDKTKQAAGAYYGTLCKLTSNAYVQQAAGAAMLVPDPTTQATAGLVKTAGMACNMMYPPKAPGMPAPPVLPTVPPGGFAPMLPPSAMAQIPRGSLATLAPEKGGYRIAVPVGLSGPAAYREVGVTKTIPAGAQVVSSKDFDAQTGAKKPLTQRPLFWGAVAVGTVAVVGGGYMLARRR
jgi:hypothetical protein